MTSAHGFSGSYAPEDVVFLLQQIGMEFTDARTKERLLQSGERHYSELLSPEYDPSPVYLDAYLAALDANALRVARGVVALARRVSARLKGRIRLVSLARAGTPVGVLLRRTLVQHFRRDAEHFSISIIAGRGIDYRALDFLRGRTDFEDGQVVFVDGWTGKGVIGRSLRRYIAEYNAARGARLDPTLHVLTDLCGSTEAAATSDDYLIPSCLLGATVNGLVSRSILNDDVIASGGFHGCRYFPEWSDRDQSRSFIEAVMAHVNPQLGADEAAVQRSLANEDIKATAALERLRMRFDHPDTALLKPGLGEATRALLRRGAARVLVRDPHDEDTKPLLLLAREKGVEVHGDRALPWRAVTLIGKIS